ncbi:hypothetical protein ACJIZ3_014653 [Penstemon smallii]|uniref:RING-type E3 ubiquitin transferase n=1 Tax=Penstemon smallii TaxID=265156 RepID=A0ABD3RKE1_9LAMI
MRMSGAVTNSGPRELAIFVHQTTRSIIVIEGSLDIESILGEIPLKEGPLPASKDSIESLPRVRILEPGHECPICLSEYEVNGEEDEVKEMPCKHRFHSGCIGKWLGIHGSCPVCRFSMPVEEEKESEERWKVHVVFAQRMTDSDSDSDSGMDMGSGGDGAPDSGSGHDGDELPAQRREIDDID